MLDFRSVQCIAGSKKSIVIRVSDNDACAQFVEIELSLEEFAQAITGLDSCKYTCNDLNKVGKIRESMNFKFEVPSIKQVYIDGLINA